MTGPHASSDSHPPAPLPHGPTPSARQLKWHDLEFYGFLHFTVNTFTDREWGYGDEPESVFNPTELDCGQWARVAKRAGMKGLILTAKHHDGFCLWPSRHTEHSVKNSPWRKGGGDVCRELADACRSYGLKLGFYNSPWDRNHAAYATGAYVDYYHAQWDELMTGYGELFELWLDGANGGDGYYGGAREKRTIDARTYYRWDMLFATMRRLQPDASIFGAEHSDIRWVGNESGFTPAPHWAKITVARTPPPRMDDHQEFERLSVGEADGADWWPAETDVSLRPGWFFHPREAPHALDHLKDLYFYSVGRGSNLLLNMTPDRRGLIPEPDEQRMADFGAFLDRTFARDIARGRPVKADTARLNAAAFAADNLTDGNPSTYWAAAEDRTTAVLEIRWDKPERVHAVRIDEQIEAGQRIEDFAVDCYVWGWVNGMAVGKTIGSRAILRVPGVACTGIRIRILRAQACPVLRRVSVYAGPAAA